MIYRRFCPFFSSLLGFHFGDFLGYPATITLSDGSIQTVSAIGYNSEPNLGFFGVTAPGGITSVDITEPAGGIGIMVTDFSRGAASSVPEPSILLLLGTGLAGVGAIRWKFCR